MLSKVVNGRVHFPRTPIHTYSTLKFPSASLHMAHIKVIAPSARDSYTMGQVKQFWCRKI